MHLFPCLSGLTGCGRLGIIIIISDRQFEPKLEPWLCTPDSSHFQLSSLFKTERVKQAGGWNKKLSRGLFITEISSTCTLYCFLKGTSIAMPNLVEVLIKGLLYCYSLHNCVRCLWKLMAQQSPAILVRLYTLSTELTFLNSVQWKALFAAAFCSPWQGFFVQNCEIHWQKNHFTVWFYRCAYNFDFKKGLKL